MLAAQMVAPGRIEAVEAPVPVPEQGEVLLQSRRASICGSDIHIVYDGFYRGEYPAAAGLPGHEGVGQVIDSRSGSFAPGDWALAVPVPTVARCFAEQQVVVEGSLIKLPEGGDPDRLLLAQQLGTVVYAFRRHWPPALRLAGPGATGGSGAVGGTGPVGGTAAICGAGSAGLFFLQLARLAGFEQVIIADRSSLRLGIAKALGADVLVDAPGQSFPEAVLEHTGGVGADLVIEAVGYDVTRIQCLEAVRPNGRVGYFGFPERPSGTSTWSYNLAWQKTPSIEITMGTQREPGLRSFHEAIDLIHTGQVNVDAFLEPAYPLTQIQDAFDAAHEQRGGKIAVVCGP